MLKHLIQIAHLAVEMRWESEQAQSRLPAAYCSFLVPSAQAPYRLQIDYSNTPPWSPSQQELDWDFFAGGVWAVSRQDRGWLFVSPSPRAAAWQRQLWWLPQEQRAHLWVRTDQAADDPLQNLTLPFFAALFARHRGVLVHAAAIEVEGKAWVFAGPSGSGKSHWTRQWLDRGSTVLHEDRIILRALEGQIWAFGTPWHLEPRYSSPQGRAVERLFFLQETSPDAIERVGAADATALLLRSCLLPVYDPESTQAVLDVAGQTTLQAETFRLGYHTGRELLDRLERM